MPQPGPTLAISSDSLDSLRAALRDGEPDLPVRLRAALAAVPAGHRDPVAWAELAEACGEPALARAEYERAATMTPGSAVVFERLAVLHEEGGNLARALECAHRSWELARTPAAFETLGGLLLTAGSYANAASLLDEAAQAGLPDDNLAAFRRRVQLTAQPDPWDAEPGSGDEPPAELPPERPPVSEALVAGDADAVRLVALFSGRENVYARQWLGEDGDVGYSPVREPFTEREARQHLSGAITAGIYPVRLDSTVLFCAFDVDVTRKAMSGARGSVAKSRELRSQAASVAARLQSVLSGLGISSLLEDSGFKGRHVWVVLAEPVAAAEVRRFGALVLRRAGAAPAAVSVEFFPKQSQAGGGIGNLIKLPLGLHRRTGRRSRFLRPDGTPEPDQLSPLRTHRRTDTATLRLALARLAEDVDGNDGATGIVAEAASGSAPVVLPTPPDVPPAWTAADFETTPELSCLFSRCAVLRALRSQVDAHRHLSHDERLVLIHTVGHSGPGVLAVNWLLDACLDTPPEARLQSPLAGNPMSCATIRRRIPHVAGSVGCRCDFSFAVGHYPTPRLHLRRLAGAAAETLGTRVRAPARWDAVDRARALGVLWAHRDRVLAEIQEVERELIDWMSAQAGAAIDTGDGVLELVQETGAAPALRWTPASATTCPAAGAVEQPAATSGILPHRPVMAHAGLERARGERAS